MINNLAATERKTCTSVSFRLIENIKSGTVGAMSKKHISNSAEGLKSCHGSSFLKRRQRETQNLAVEMNTVRMDITKDDVMTMFPRAIKNDQLRSNHENPCTGVIVGERSGATVGKEANGNPVR